MEVIIIDGGINFNVNVQTLIDASQLDSLEQRIEKLKKESITLKIKPDANVDNFMKVMERQFQNSGQRFGKQVSNSIFKTSELKKNGQAYMTKVSKSIDSQMREIQKMANVKGWKDFSVDGIETANGSIKQLKLTVTEATGAVKKLNFERQKIQTDKGNIYNGLVQSDNVKIVKTAEEAQAERLKADLKLEQKSQKEAEKQLLAQQKQQEKQEQYKKKQHITSYEDDYKTLKSSLKTITTYDEQIAKLDPVKNKNEISELISQREELAKTYSKNFGSFLDKTNTDPYIQEIANMEKLIELSNIYAESQNRIAQIKSKISDSERNKQEKEAEKQLLAQQKQQEKQVEKQTQQISAIQRNVSNGNYNAKQSTMTTKLSDYVGQDFQLLRDARQQSEIYGTTLKQLQDHFDSNKSFTLQDEEVVKAFENMTSAGKKFDNIMTQINNTQSKSLDAGVAERSANNVKKYYDNNSRAIKKYGEALKDLENRYREVKTVNGKLQLDAEYTNLKAKISAEGLSGNSAFKELGRGFKQIGQFAYTYGAIYKILNMFTQSITELKELDDTLTEISKTSNMTKSQLKELGESSFESASKFGKKANDYLIGVQEMNRSGFYGKQGTQLAELSILAQAAGNMTTDVSNSYLLATNAAYDYAGSAEKLNAVLDGQNMITNRNSVSMGDMAEATSKAASMAAQTGVKVNELSAIIGTSVARTKQNGNEIGTALKSLFINLQDTSNKKIVSTFNQLGISQKKYVNGTEQLKTPIELLRELADAYNKLPDGSALKADVLRNIGNKRQANVLSAILGGISNGEYDKMITDYSQGTGSAAEEAMKSANNWSGTVNKLSNSWTDLVANFANSDAIVSCLNLINSLVSGVDNLSESIGSFGTIGGLLGMFLGFKNAGKLYCCVENCPNYIVMCD